jgi:hypothetical protein
MKREGLMMIGLLPPQGYGSIGARNVSRIGGINNGLE